MRVEELDHILLTFKSYLVKNAVSAVQLNHHNKLSTLHEYFSYLITRQRGTGGVRVFKIYNSFFNKNFTWADSFKPVLGIFNY